MPSTRASPGIMVFRVCSMSTTGAFRLFLKCILITYSSNKHATKGSLDDMQALAFQSRIDVKELFEESQGRYEGLEFVPPREEMLEEKVNKEEELEAQDYEPLYNTHCAELTTQYICQSHISFTKFSTPKLLSQLSSDPKPQPHSPSTFFFPSPSTQPLHPSRDSQHRHNPKLLPNSSSE